MIDTYLTIQQIPSYKFSFDTWAWNSKIIDVLLPKRIYI